MLLLTEQKENLYGHNRIVFIMNTLTYVQPTKNRDCKDDLTALMPVSTSRIAKHSLLESITVCPKTSTRRRIRRFDNAPAMPANLLRLFIDIRVSLVHTRHDDLGRPPTI